MSECVGHWHHGPVSELGVPKQCTQHHWQPIGVDREISLPGDCWAKVVTELCRHCRHYQEKTYKPL